MPRIVDREARRREIVDTYLALVARDGMEAATTRHLAQELGIATGALWHYFANFQEVLEAAFDLVFERTSARIAERVGPLTGLRALLRMIEQIHPLDKVSDDEALVVVHFWGRVTAQHHGTVRSAFSERRWQDEYRVHLDEALVDGELVETAPTASLANALLVLALGQQVTRVLDSPLADASTQWDTIRTIIEPWLTDLGRERAGWDGPAS